jgi:DNA-binding MarR family transcriptional regulator
MPIQNPHGQPLYKLIVEIRSAFNALKALSDEMNADIGITAAMRAVMEHLETQRPATVPQIAAAKSVTRQHIQILADALVDKGFARYVANPAHQRSRLLELTDFGTRHFAEIRNREAEALGQLAQGFETTDLERATATLARLRSALNTQ